ncbi:MAG: aminoglycoside phosphotransferase, partial [Thermoleophilia bacterium]|nr:aminoglycoside phosphotransferase [Thermoleophilia bacterium]
MSPLLGDASTRRFYRIRLADGETRVLMDYGESFSGETDDLILGRVFRDAGLPVASVREVSGEAGCLLLEDLGDCTLDAALLAEDDEASRLGLLERAVLLAVDVAARGTPALEKSP